MLEREAKWLGERLAELPVSDISPLLDIGSGDSRYREQLQPHVEAVIFAPQRERGVQVVHSDLKPGDGIDLVGNIFDDNHLRTLASVQPQAVICSNVHEHVADPADLSRRYLSLLPVGGYAAATAPHSFPYHRDPIDTLFRPDPNELAALHSGAQIISVARVVECTYADEIRRRPLRLLPDLLQLPGVIRDTGSIKNWRLMWLGRHYQVSCVLVRKASEPN
jgi:hypothetical protein